MTNDLTELVAVLRTIAAGLIAVRDRALLLLGFAAALHRSELTALDVGDLQPDPRGLVMVVRSPKADRHGAGAVVGLPFGQRAALCPVAAAQASYAALGAALAVSFEQLEGSMFRPITRRLVARRRCERAGLDPEAYAAHSLRSGFATPGRRQRRNPARRRASRPLTFGHRHPRLVQRGNLFTNNATGRVAM